MNIHMVSVAPGPRVFIFYKKNIAIKLNHEHNGDVCSFLAFNQPRSSATERDTQHSDV